MKNIKTTTFGVGSILIVAGSILQNPEMLDNQEHLTTAIISIVNSLGLIFASDAKD